MNSSALRRAAVGLAATATLAAPAAAAAKPTPPVSLTSFGITPSCVAEGGNITASVTVQDNRVLPMNWYSIDNESLYGFTVQQDTVSGPNPSIPFVATNGSETSEIPWYTPPGRYKITFSIGTQNNPSQWGTKHAYVTVNPFC
jgi:hypothetical protein